MSRRYDSRTNTFNQEGRIKQIEYALDAIKNTGPALGILCKDGIVLATERQSVSTLLERSKHSEKIYKLDNHIFGVVSGLTADANFLIDFAREVGQKFRMTLRNPMPVEQMVLRLCDLKQSYTQYGGQRPFGTSFIIAGWDDRAGFQLVSTDPAGNYLKWRAFANGKNEANANSHLLKRYTDDITTDDALLIAVETICKTLDSASPDPEKIELVKITKDEDNEALTYQELTNDEVAALLKTKEENEKKKE